MKKTTSLCFSKDGLLNSDAVSYLLQKDIDTVIFFTDGSSEAYDHLLNFDIDILSGKAQFMGLGKTPLYELRVVQTDNTLSKPHYVYSEEIRMKWICSKICTHYLTLSISDITSQTKTQVELDNVQTELVCYLAYKLWTALRVAEDRLLFPAIVIDRLTRWTYSLTPQTIDIPVLRKEIGLNSLDYDLDTDLLSITVGEDVFSVKLSVLNAFYSAHILPLFNTIFGRRLRISVLLTSDTGTQYDQGDVSYGELGRMVDEMQHYAKQKIISAESAMDPEDLLAFAKRVKINNDSCLWPTPSQSFKDFVTESRSELVRENMSDNDNHTDYLEEELA